MTKRQQLKRLRATYRRAVAVLDRARAAHNRADMACDVAAAAYWASIHPPKKAEAEGRTPVIPDFETIMRETDAEGRTP